MEKIFSCAALGVAALFFAAGSVLLWRVTPERIGAAERFLRRRKTGTVIAALALAWCVPQIEAVAWRSLVPWVWPLAIAAVILAYLYLDNLVARGIAGLLIMGAYSFVQLSFAQHLATGVWGAIVAWSWGIAGIMIAGKPCWLRDYLRLSAKHPVLRYAASGYAMLTAILAVAAAVLLWLNWKN